MSKKLKTYFNYTLASALHFPSWTVLRFVGNSRWATSAYFWIFLVPLMVRVLEKLPPEVQLEIFEQTWVLVLDLPFSWRVFYLSAVAFAIGQMVFWLGCPWIIRDFSHYTEFKAEGRGGEYLERYTSWVASRPGKKHPDFFRESLQLVGEPVKNAQSLFWSLRLVTERLFPVRRVVCSILYTIGLAGISWVLVENFIFVVHYLQRDSVANGSAL